MTSPGRVLARDRLQFAIELCGNLTPGRSVPNGSVVFNLNGLRGRFFQAEMLPSSSRIRELDCQPRYLKPHPTQCDRYGLLPKTMSTGRASARFVEQALNTHHQRENSK